MYRYKVLGSTRNLKILIVYVTAASREQAVDRAFDDMGLWVIASVRKIGKKLAN